MNKQNVGIIVRPDYGLDIEFIVCSEEDYNDIIQYNTVNMDDYEEFVDNLLYDESGEYTEKVLVSFYTQNFSSENLDFSKYNVIGIVQIPNS